MIKRIQILVVLVSFFFNMGLPSVSFAQSSQTILNLPVPGTLLSTSPSFTPALIKGLKIDAKNALGFNFIVDTGDTNLTGDALKQESNKMIKYFLAALTVPEKDLWVNLSPYEKDRIIAGGFGRTEMGRDMLGQDYVLKQLTASLIYPESRLGKTFWAKVYQKAQEQYGTTNIPVNTFNKVWIVPDHALIYEHDGTAFVVENKLKVMLEQDYLSLQKHMNKNDINALGSQVIREVLIPEIEKEVNTGKNFATLRQIANAAVLAAWYKQALKESLLGKIYADKNKIKGLSFPNASGRIDRHSQLFVGNPEHIYQQYLQAFKKGVYNYIREDFDPLTNRTVPRKYFSGGTKLDYSMATTIVGDVDLTPQLRAKIEQMSSRAEHVFNVGGLYVTTTASDQANQAMLTELVLSGQARALRNLVRLNLNDGEILEAIESAKSRHGLFEDYDNSVNKSELMNAIKSFKEKIKNKPEELDTEALKIGQKYTLNHVLLPKNITGAGFWIKFAENINAHAVDRAMAAESGSFEAAVQIKRKPVVGYNMKGELLTADVDAFLEGIAADYRRNLVYPNRVDVVAIFAEGDLKQARAKINQLVEKNAIPKGFIKLGAQNIRAQGLGAYTAHAPSITQLKDWGVEVVLLGHSEIATKDRGEPTYVESDELIAQKLRIVVKNDLQPILAYGETKSENDAGRTKEVLTRQLTVRLGMITPEQMINSKLVAAYEPVWAIGEGAKPAPKEIAEEFTRLSRQIIFDTKGYVAAANTPILYGGSMSAKNVDELRGQPNIDGGLIGGASKKWDTAAPIYRSFANKFAADRAMAAWTLFHKAPPRAGSVQELLRHIAGVVSVTPEGVEVLDKVLDQTKLKEETVYYLVDEARFGANEDIKKSAQRLLREIGIYTGRKEASIHDFYMARLRGKWNNMTVPAINVRTGPAFDTMKDIFITVEKAKVGMVIFELDASEMRYTGQDADEYTAMVYGAAIATGYKGLLFMQADNYQTSAADYFSGNTPEEKTAAKEKAIEKVKDNISKAVLAGELNIDLDTSTLMFGSELKKVLDFERNITTRYINYRISVDVEFAKEIESLGGLKEKSEDESDWIWSIRRKLTDDLEIGLEIPAYKDSLSAQEIEYLQKFGLTGLERKVIGGLYETAYEETKKVTKIYIEYIRGLELGIKTPISIGVEASYRQSAAREIPSTVLGSMTMMRDIIEWCAEKKYAQPSKLTLQTGTMHGLGGVVDWGIYQRHLLAVNEIGVAVFVQRGTSTLSSYNFSEMPKAGSGEAHLDTVDQKYTFEEIGKLAPKLSAKMKAFVEALMNPEAAEADLNPGIVEKLKAAKLWDRAKREDYESKFLKTYQEDTIKGLKAHGWEDWGEVYVHPPKNEWTQKEAGDIFTGMLGDTLAKPYTGKLKDLIKELAGPFKREIAELPKNVYDAIHERMRAIFARIYKAQNVENTRDLIERLIPYKSVEVALPVRPEALTAAVKAAQVSKADAAALTTKPNVEGGINLDPAMYSIQIKRDGRGIPLPVDQQPIDKINISGIRVVIQTVTPANLSLMLGIDQTSQTLAMSN